MPAHNMPSANMPSANSDRVTGISCLTDADYAALRRSRVLIAGLGNIGAGLAMSLSRLVNCTLVDRDRVEAKNLRNQDYADASDVGRFKAEVVAARIRRAVPEALVEAIPLDLEDVPAGVVAGVDACLGALDSLRARQLLITERAYPLGVPVVDGGVGEPLVGRVHVFLPGDACLECAWSEAHYRHLAREYPCIPGGAATGAATRSPAFLGATVAGIMAAEVVQLLLGRGPEHSLEIAFDLASRRFLTSRLRVAARCRCTHEVVRELLPLGAQFEVATVADLLAILENRFGATSVQLDVRRGLFGDGLFGSRQFVSCEQLRTCSHRRLADLGLVTQDRIRVKVEGQPGSAYVCFDGLARTSLSAEAPCNA